MKIELEGGKYTYLLHEDGRQEALRYGDPWRDLVGDKFVYCMAVCIESLTAERDTLEQENKRLVEALEHHQAQTRPIQRTIEVLASVKEKP